MYLRSKFEISKISKLNFYKLIPYPMDRQGPPNRPRYQLTVIIIIIMYLYSAQYLHIVQDSKRYLTNPTVQVQPQLTSNSHSPNWKIEAQG